jgi:hypothetical protein
LGQRRDGERHLGPAAFGVGLLTDLTLPGAWKARVLAEPILRIRSATAREIAQSWSGVDGIGWEGLIDGAPFVVERGRAGDHRFIHGTRPDRGGTPSAGTRAIHHLAPDASVLRCAPADADERSWWRVVLDSVLFTVALLRDYEALHAGAVATPDGVIAIAATTGGGKSTLLTELLRDGLTLMADDVLVLEPQDAEAPLAHPAPPLMTVPVARASLFGGQDRPETICSLDQERWIAVPVHPDPLPLTALVVLNRQPGLATELHRADRPLAALLSSLLRFPRTRTRERDRFELAGTIAAHVPIWELNADLSVGPDALADLLLTRLVGSQSATGALSTVV